jgi:biopolymer transport protein ExbD
MKKTTRRGHSTLTELNITPLLDLVFVLLVIFIITTPQMVNVLPMSLPSGAKPKVQNTNDLPKIHRILVDDDGRVFLNEVFVPDDKLHDTLNALKEEEDAPKVVLKGSDLVEYLNMIKVMDTLQQLEITNIGLATQ